MEKENFNVHLHASGVFGRNASRAEIEGCLAEHGIPIPLQHSVSFTITDASDKNFVVSFVKEINVYLVIKPKVV